MDDERDVKILDVLALIFNFAMLISLTFFGTMYKLSFEEIKCMLSISGMWNYDSFVTASVVAMIVMIAAYVCVAFYVIAEVQHIIDFFGKRDGKTIVMNRFVLRWTAAFPQKRYIRRIESETLGEKYKKQKLDRIFRNRRKYNILCNLVGITVLFGIITLCCTLISMVLSADFPGSLTQNGIKWLDEAYVLLVPLAIALLYSAMYDIKLSGIMHSIVSYCNWIKTTVKNKEYKKCVSFLRRKGVLHILTLLLMMLVMYSFVNANVFSYKLVNIHDGKVSETGCVNGEDFVRRINSTTREEALISLAESGAADDGATCAIMSIIGATIYAWIVILLIVIIRKMKGKKGGATAISGGLLMMTIYFVSGIILTLEANEISHTYGKFVFRGDINAVFSTGMILPMLTGLLLTTLYYFLHSKRLKRYLGEIK